MRLAATALVLAVAAALGASAQSSPAESAWSTAATARWTSASMSGREAPGWTAASGGGVEAVIPVAQPGDNFLEETLALHVWNLSLPAIPAGSIITGVEFGITREASGGAGAGTGRDYAVFLMRGRGTAVPAPALSTEDWPTAGPATVTYPPASAAQRNRNWRTWGLERAASEAARLQPSDFGENFGIMLVAQRETGSSSPATAALTLRVRDISVSVTYDTDSSLGNVPTSVDEGAEESTGETQGQATVDLVALIAIIIAAVACVALVLFLAAWAYSNRRREAQYTQLESAVADAKVTATRADQTAKRAARRAAATSDNDGGKRRSKKRGKKAPEDDHAVYNTTQGIADIAARRKARGDDTTSDDDSDDSDDSKSAEVINYHPVSTVIGKADDDM